MASVAIGALTSGSVLQLYGWSGEHGDADVVGVPLTLVGTILLAVVLVGVHVVRPRLGGPLGVVRRVGLGLALAGLLAFGHVVWWFQVVGLIPLVTGTALFGAAAAVQGVVPRGPASLVAAGPLVALAATSTGLALGPDEWVYAFSILYPLSFAWLAWSLWTGLPHRPSRVVESATCSARS